MKYIYGLVDPRTRGVRYIGQTDDLARRLQQHLQEKENTAKGEWIRGLRDQNLIPSIISLAIVNDHENAHDIEFRWIYFGRQNGWELTNTVGMRSEEYYSLQGYFERLIVEMEKPEGVIAREYSMGDVKQGLLRNLVWFIESFPSIFRFFGASVKTEWVAGVFGFLSVITYWLILSPPLMAGPATLALAALTAIAAFGGLTALAIIALGLFGNKDIDEKVPTSLLWTVGFVFVGLSALTYLFV